MQKLVNKHSMVVQKRKDGTLMKNPSGVFFKWHDNGVSWVSPEHSPFPQKNYYDICLSRTTCSILTPLMMPKTSQKE